MDLDYKKEVEKDQRLHGNSCYYFFDQEGPMPVGDLLQMLCLVNSEEEKIVIFCDERFSRCTDFKTKVPSVVIIAEEEPNYTSSVQIIGRAQRRLEETTTVTMFVKASSRIART